MKVVLFLSLTMEMSWEQTQSPLSQGVHIITRPKSTRVF